VQIVRIRRGPESDLIIRLPTGLHAAVAMSWTDYAALPALEVAATTLHLLDIDGLRRAAELVARLRQEEARSMPEGASCERSAHSIPVLP